MRTVAGSADRFFPSAYSGSQNQIKNMAISDLEKLETLCHVRAIMHRTREYVMGRDINKDYIVQSLESGMEAMNLLIIDSRFKEQGSRGKVEGTVKDESK